MEKILRDIAGVIKGDIIGNGDVSIIGINSIDKASAGEISFYFDNRYRDYLEKTKASALIVSSHEEGYKGPQVVVTDPKLAYAKAAALFAPPVSRFDGISRNAFIEETGMTGKNVSIYPNVYVGKEAVIGDNVTLFPGTFIGDRVRIGDRTVIYPNVSIMRDCIVGEDVIIHAGCVIGSDGFGYAQDGSEHVKVPQLGIVQIDDNVEIGANTTIDRAANGRTWIQKGVKMDNLIQIGHNVMIGENSILVAHTAIAGSVRVGRNVVIGGKVGIVDHIDIGDGAVIGSGAGVRKSIAPGETVLGDPTMPHRHWMRVSSLIARLPEINDRLRDLEKRVKGSGKDN
ncbi:MAG: UDP-3-O-(3-hydroxymyristoyl)glucosamine N-acyltransferase [Deltaproteobacteria bacterium]|nr:UDP-3-O-(3-hydroxymyristoyl)glucosamine N-acyltransferase [Deltaproteobacteria bacterium]